ncbi:hypothetical protein [Rhodopseudomonas pseudopalustris]|uniref:Class I SAM-dependent methyltransferase n=2 Tax=Rhodopseudomonas TaxID=1073 RepID=Q130S7_RHOPS|nr:hypothetical protein [Rhodopseudomonas pseudopalustris]ABE41412.1 conserved hypothetical protein [Rhodopseudomonas palustris BisB5]MBB1090226.1 class I SAM-dependent methyltransferase [Rhodopseudomonas palustris]SEO05343.1 hypothetical protein SAMN05444123_101105 [Rhodopseudomonas pseudopalustris]
MSVNAISKQIDIPGVTIDAAAFFGLEGVTRVRQQARLGLTEQSYLPKASDPHSDWVARVAAPAFRALAEMGVKVEDFCTIGTGAGLDALAAIEILRVRNVFVTDLHEDVVQQARQNILMNVLPPQPAVFAGVGDLLDPLKETRSALDLIYENLPNIPLGSDDDLAEGQASSTFIADRKEGLPDFVRQHLIALHYLALRQAYPMLRPGGRVLSSIGGRIPVEVILRLGRETGYASHILVLAWKIQSEPEDVIGGYARWEREGLGPFRFYPRAVLERTLSPMSAVAAAAQAIEIERALQPDALSAEQALQAHLDGVEIGHTVFVLESQKL